MFVLLGVSIGNAAFAGPSFKYGTYGTLNLHRSNVYKNIQDNDPQKRWRVDLERLTFETETKFSQRLELETEIEIEHGGTGSTLEFDSFHEFGEFESEVEQGGEVKLEKIQLLYQAKNWLNLKMGYLGVPIGWTSSRDLPTDYFSVERNRAEAQIIPSAWREVGVGFSGDIGNWVYEYAYVTAPNSEFFRKYNWIAGGSRRRFESNFADAFAHVFRLDYGFARDHNAIGAAVYSGNGTPNRQKTGKLTDSSGVFIADIHALYSWHGLKVRGLYLRGFLDNAELVSQANSSLSGLANPGVYSTVGRQAEAAYLEAGYDLSNLWPEYFSNNFDVFLRYDHWDTMKLPPKDGIKDPRFEETQWTGGINAYLTPEVLVKAEYAQARSGLASLAVDHRIAFGLGFKYFPTKGDGTHANE